MTICLLTSNGKGYSMYRDRLALGVNDVARFLASYVWWEEPHLRRKNWRRRKDDGTYEYREKPPEQSRLKFGGRLL